MTYELPVNVGVSQKAALINKDGKILVLLRGAGAPAAPLSWDLPGGDVDWGEDALESMARETKEETGVELSVDAFEIYDVHTRINEEDYHWFTIGYLVRVDNPDIKISWEHDEYRWVDAKEFASMKAAEKIRRFVDKAFERA